MSRLGIRCSGGLSTMADPFVLYSYYISTPSELIRSDIISLDHAVLRRTEGNLFKGNTEGGNKVRPMMVLLVAGVISEVEAAEASEAKERTEITQTTNRTMATSPLLVASQYPLVPNTSGRYIRSNTHRFAVSRQRNIRRRDS